MSNILGEMENVEVKTLQHLREVQSVVIKKLFEKSIFLNQDKPQYEQEKVKFLGHYVGERGLEVDPARIEAIDKLKPPTKQNRDSKILGIY